MQHGYLYGENEILTNITFRTQTKMQHNILVKFQAIIHYDNKCSNLKGLAARLAPKLSYPGNESEKTYFINIKLFDIKIVKTM